MTCVRSTLEADNDIGFLCQHIGNLAFSLVSPVCTNNCFNHSFYPPDLLHHLIYGHRKSRRKNLLFIPCFYLLIIHEKFL